VLGLATEVGKLTESERRQVIDWAAEDIGGRVPLAVTIFGNSIPEQTALLRHAEIRGASWVILQPPMLGSYGAAEVRAFFAAVAAETKLPVAIQNAPQLMGRGFTAAEIVELVTQHPNITHLKCEMPVLDMQAIAEATGGRLVLLNGQGGMELTDNLRAGCDGFVLAPDIADWAVRIHAAWQAGDEERAERLYAEALPAIVFAMRSLEHLIAYGKRLFAARAGLAVFDRAPALRPRPFGLDRVADYAKRLGPLA
jgi:dihydrodipicolinate synthase/N-acetylneuraminate lyase